MLIIWIIEFCSVGFTIKKAWGRFVVKKTVETMKNNYGVDYYKFNVDPTSFRLFMVAMVLGAFMLGLLIGASYAWAHLKRIKLL